ncbi:hypothetical protein BaRGS_00024036 [Batillaria attramentaria]|uniref:Uncharacterized protein n=1 Tax=Batillaria attramentaria TaxID=370345 RepID=A0ABD0KC69_9CAEN
MIPCSRSQLKNVLCEIESTPTETKTDPIIRLAQQRTLTASPSYVQCSAGHVTHTFLACDVKSACWKRSYGTSAVCLAPLTPLPPSFTCADGVERVPYTLVCDHRADCRDASDEDFCVYPPSTYSKNFQCGDGQVFQIMPSDYYHFNVLSRGHEPHDTEPEKNEQCMNLELSAFDDDAYKSTYSEGNWISQETNVGVG